MGKGHCTTMRAVFAVFCLVMVATQGDEEVTNLSVLDDLALSEDTAQVNTTTVTRTVTTTVKRVVKRVVPQVKGPFGDLQTQDADLKTMWADAALQKTVAFAPYFGGGRVNEPAFKKFMKAKYGANTNETAAYDEFLGTVFAAATSMMLPDVKTDLGEHCFTYAAAFAGEFYFNGSAPDRLKLKGEGCLCEDLDTSWTEIPKDNGRVAKASFVAFFAGKYSADITTNKTAAFQTFADKVFTAATSMMLPKSKTDLGEHCFKYAAGLIGEFYF